MKKICLCLYLAGFSAVYAQTPVVLANHANVNQKSISIFERYSQANDLGKITVCAPVLAKHKDLMGRAISLRIKKGIAADQETIKSLFKLGYLNELANAFAQKQNRQAYAQAFTDAARDPSLLKGYGKGEGSLRDNKIFMSCLSYLDAPDTQSKFNEAQTQKAATIGNQFVQKVLSVQTK